MILSISYGVEGGNLESASDGVSGDIGAAAEGGGELGVLATGGGVLLIAGL